MRVSSCSAAGAASPDSACLRSRMRASKADDPTTGAFCPPALKKEPLAPLPPLALPTPLPGRPGLPLFCAAIFEESAPPKSGVRPARALLPVHVGVVMSRFLLRSNESSSAFAARSATLRASTDAIVLRSLSVPITASWSSAPQTSSPLSSCCSISVWLNLCAGDCSGRW
eukprot:1102315-Pleurochrysis_carterae.AAC.1